MRMQSLPTYFTIDAGSIYVLTLNFNISIFYHFVVLSLSTFIFTTIFGCFPLGNPNQVAETKKSPD